VRARHTAAAVSATFDELSLVSWAGLVPVLRLAERAEASTHKSTKNRICVNGGSPGPSSSR
jgi:hypothetical protein